MYNFGYFGSTDAQHLAAFKTAADTFDLVVARLKARPSLCSPDALGDVTTLRGLADVMIAHGAAGAEGVDKALVQARIIDAENVANSYIRQLGQGCLVSKPPQTPTSPADMVAAVNNLPTSSKWILGGVAAVLGLGVLKSIFG